MIEFLVAEIEAGAASAVGAAVQDRPDGAPLDPTFGAELAGELAPDLD